MKEDMENKTGCKAQGALSGGSGGCARTRAADKELSSGLSFREEKLLQAYFDSECGAIGRWWARRLLARRRSAGAFFESLRVGAREVLGSFDGGADAQQGGEKVDLWNRISARIDQEERSLMFLGKRDFRERAQGVWRLSWTRPVGWGLSGAVVTAGVAMLIFGQFSPQAQSAFSAAGSPSLGGDAQANPSYQPVAMDMGESDFRAEAGTAEQEMSSAHALNRKVPRALEVDWMRSHGRVRMIQDSSDRAAILWVNRDSKLGSSRRSNSRIPSLTPVAASQDKIRILDDDLPTAFSAYDR